MKSVKIAAVVMIVGAGLIGSYFTLKGSVKTIPTGPAVASSTEALKSLAALSEKPFEWTETLKNFIGEVARNNDDGEKKTEEINLTRLVAQSLFNRAKGLDADGKEPFSKFNPEDPENQKAINDAIRSLGGSEDLFTVAIRPEEIHTVEATAAAKKRYLDSVASISSHRLSDDRYGRDPEQLIADVNNDCFGGGESPNKDLSAAYGAAASDYADLLVPADWYALHRDIVSYFHSMSLIYGAIASCSADPIKGYLAVQILPSFLERSDQIQAALEPKFKEVGMEG